MAIRNGESKTLEYLQNVKEEVLSVIKARGKCTASELARIFDLSMGEIGMCLLCLRSEGLIEMNQKPVNGNSTFLSIRNEEA